MLSSSAGLQLFCALLLSAHAGSDRTTGHQRCQKQSHPAGQGRLRRRRRSLQICHSSGGDSDASDEETMSPNLGFNSWVAFTSATHEAATVAGEFLLLEDEVNPVLAAREAMATLS
jgi:hypothetical protein